MSAGSEGVSSTAVRSVGRYVLFDELAAGGMATVHVGRLRGTAGFKRTVAIKRLHAQFARDPEFVAAFLDEAQLVARITHPNVVPVLDVVAEEGELFMVMEYVHGDSLSRLLKAAAVKRSPPRPAIVAQIVTGLLYGLHAAHEARSDRGAPLQIVHRDVSPQNVLVGVDGGVRVLDFGVAKAAQKVQETTKEGVIKGKLAYMPPEQLRATPDVDRRVDIYAAGVVFWEALTGRRLVADAELGAMVARILWEDAPPPTSLVPGLPPELDAIVAKALAKDRDQRFATALDMAHAIENVLPPIPPREIGEWVASVADERLRHRAELISKTEKVSLPPPPGSCDSLHDVIEAGQRASDPGWTPAPSAGSSARPPIKGATVTQVMLGVPGKRPLASRARRGLVVVIALAGVIASAAVVARTKRGTRSTGEASRSAPPAAPASAGAAAAASDPQPSIEIVEVPVSVAPDASPSPGPRAAIAARPALPGAASAPRRAGKKDCDPPWTLDARGVRVIKRECL